MSTHQPAASQNTDPVIAQKKFISKVKVGLLAALFGGVGAHWWYLGRPRAWVITAIGMVLMTASGYAKTL